MDFTLSTYKQLLLTLQFQGFLFLNFEEYIQNPKGKVVILRHDVDLLPKNALRMAKLEADLGIKSTYFFRTVSPTFDRKTIIQIGEMGHGIGYHYENLSTCGGDLRLALEDFEKNLEKLREFYPVKTICMHGSPLSKFDNKKIWEKYDYRDFGIIADPSFDIDYDEVFYITDTGRSWNNSNASVRDKVDSKFDITIKDTHHLIGKIQNNELPDKIMINVHPQRWNDNSFGWYKELILQSLKNQVKSIIVKYKRSRNG